MPAYFSDTPTLADRRAQRIANAAQRKREKALATLKDRKPLRSSPPSRTAPPKRKAPPAKKNAKRAKANHERAYGEYAKWIRTLPCLICGHVGHTVAAHTRTGGMSRKSDAKWLVPLCCTHFIPDPEMGAWWEVEGCHEESHRGIKTFEAKYHVDLKAIAAQLWADYSRVSGGGREGR